MNTRDRYLIIEDTGRQFRAIEAVVDESDGTVAVIRESVADTPEAIRRPAVPADKLVISLLPDRATTVESAISIPRTQSGEPITPGELDHLVFKGLWEFLNEYRGWAAHKMRIPDFDMILTNVEISNVAVDGHAVVDPLGVEGDRIIFTIRGTFVPRSVLSLVEAVRRFGRLVRVVEGLAISTAFIGGDGTVVHGGARRTYVYGANDETVRFRYRRRWGIELIEQAVESLLGIDRKTTLAILDRYFTDRLSNRLASRITDRIERQLKQFSRLVEEAAGVQQKTIINVPRVLYDAAPLPRRGVSCSDVLSTLANRGFRVIMETEKSHPLHDVSYLACIGHPLFSGHHDELNRIIRRRARWLTHNNRK